MPRPRGKDGFDIVVLNYNNDGHIQKCIGSILAKTEGQFNLIVVDQGSTDGSREWIVKNQTSISHLILNDENSGAWEGRNQALRESRYPWVCFLDSDTEIQDQNWIDKMWLYTIDSNVGIVEARVKLWDGTWRFAGFAACMIRKRVFREIGLFDGKFLIGGDLDFWTRFAWNGNWQIAFADDTDIFHFCGATLFKGERQGQMINGALGHRREELDEKYRKKLLRDKHAEHAIVDYLMPINRKREEEEIARGWRNAM